MDPARSDSSGPLVPSGSHRAGSTGSAPGLPGPGVPLPAGGRWGQYQLLTELGRGAFGVVYRARHLPSGTEVALKVLLRTSARALQRFQREVEAVRRLDHPQLVRLLDVGVQGAHPFLVTELIAGSSLAALLLQGPLAPFRAAELVLDAAGALQHAHERGVLHRDVKPANLLVDARGAHLVDFGLARLSEVDSDLTQSGTLVGTGAYLSPEQARGERAGVSERSDVYGLGATFYEALTGRPPFVATGLQELLIAIGEQAPPAPRSLRAEVPRALEAVCLKCLEKDPADRYPSAAALAVALQEALEGPSAPSRRPTGRRAALVVLGLGLLAGALVLTTPPASAPPPSPTSPGGARAPRPEPRADAPTPSVSEPAPLPVEPGRPRWEASPGATDARRVGPWALLTGDGSLHATRGERPIVGPPHAGPAASWDPTAQVLLLAHPDGVLTWTPGEGGPRPRLELGWQPASLALVGETVLVGSDQGQLLAFAAESREPRWHLSLGGRIAGAPLGLDLDADGRAERLLVATSASRLLLLDLATGARAAELDLPSPAYATPLLLSPAPSAQVLVACREGVLARYAIEASSMTPGRALDLERALLTPPTPLATAAGRRVVIGTRFGWLFCVDEALERVEWAVNRDATPVGEVAVVDLDLDGEPEVCSAWIQPQGATVSAELLVLTADGTPALELPCGDRPLHLAGGAALPLLGAGTKSWAWGPWTRLRARPRREDEVWAQLAGGAYSAARDQAAELPAEGARRLRALAESHQGRPAALESLLAEAHPAVQAALRPAVEGWLRRGDLAAARQLGEPLGSSWGPPEQPPLQRLPLAPLDEDPKPSLVAGAALALELRRQPALAHGLEQVQVAGGRFRAGEAREQGLLVGVQGRLRAAFFLDQAGPARLHLLHRCLPYHVPGYASYQLVLDGRRAGPAREAPPFGSAYEHEQVELGELAAGEHVLEIVVLPQATTLYSLARLELEVR